MPTATYDLIASNVLTSSAASVTFSSIPATYRDLVLVATATAVINGGQPFLRFNGDSSSSYSQVFAEGSGTTAYGADNSGTQLYLSYNLGLVPDTTPASMIINIMDYSATDKHKMVMTRQGSSAFVAGMMAGRWPSTSAINSITLTGNGDFASGSSFYLYGIVS
jgi:hypothetical protein